MVGNMKHYHDYDNLIMRHPIVPVLISFSVRPWFCKSSAPEHCLKYFAKFIDHYEFFVILSSASKAIKVFFVIQYYKSI